MFVLDLAVRHVHLVVVIALFVRSIVGGLVFVQEPTDGGEVRLLEAQVGECG